MGISHPIVQQRSESVFLKLLTSHEEQKCLRCRCLGRYIVPFSILFPFCLLLRHWLAVQLKESKIFRETVPSSLFLPPLYRWKQCSVGALEWLSSINLEWSIESLGNGYGFICLSLFFIGRLCLKLLVHWSLSSVSPICQLLTPDEGWVPVYCPSTLAIC